MIFREKILANTLESIGVARKYWKEPFCGGCNRVKLQDPESQRRQDYEKSIGSRSLKGSSTWGRLGLEGSCYLCA